MSSVSLTRSALPPGSLAGAAPLGSALGSIWSRLCAHLQGKSRRLVGYLDARLDRMLAFWVLALLAIGVVKVARAPLAVGGADQAVIQWLPYLLIALSPLAGYRIARSAFPKGRLVAQPALRLAQVGRWERIDPVEASANPSFGPTGLLASLLLGLLLDVPVRTLEYLASVPSVGAGAPAWAQVYFTAMTAQVVALNFFGMVALVMALHKVPLFPRMLLFVWLFDLLMQLLVAAKLAATPGLPPQVVEPLVTLLNGNVHKVLISMLVWLPYLLLSERINITYRQRRSRR